MEKPSHYNQGVKNHLTIREHDMKRVLFCLIATATPSLGQIVSTAGKVDAKTQSGFGGRLEVTYQSANGNSDYTIYGGDADLRYSAGSHVVIYLGNRTYGKDDTKVFANSHFSHLRYRRYVVPAFALEVFGQQSTNPFKNLKNREVLGGGLRKEFGGAALGVAIMQESEYYTDDIAGEVNNRFSFFLSYKHQAGTMGLDMVVYYQPRIRETSNAYTLFDPEDRRLLAEIGIRFKIHEKLAYKLTGKLTYDTMPPNENVDKRDVVVKNALVYEF